MKATQAGPAPEMLWANLRSKLDRSVDATDPQADVAAAAGLFDLLSNSDRAALARYMYEELKDGLKTTDPLTPVQHAVLGLVDPYLTNSDLEPETRILLGNALSQAGRAFQDDFAIAQGLIDLNYRTPGSDDLWAAFYARYADEEETRHDAFDVALAGLAPWNLRRFRDLIIDQPAESWLIDRIDMFLPTLTRSFTPAEVSELLQTVYNRCTEPLERRRILILSEAYDLTVAKEADTPPVEPVPSLTVPEPLQVARSMVETELRSDPVGTRKALERSEIHVFRSGYAGDNAINLFQHQVFDKIRELAESSKLVTSSETTDFAELYSPFSLDKKHVFAFPTYLTAAKRTAGYSCASFGWQRRIGILFPRGHRLHGQEPPVTLEEMLHEIMADGGMICCLRNYAISEIVWQAASRDRQLETYFDLAHVHVCERRHSVPIVNTKSRNFVFLFDLSQWRDLERRTSGSAPATRKKNKQPRDTWIKRARLATLAHSEPVKVGIVFSKYMVDWLSANGRWTDIEAFVAAHASRPAFAKALSALGVDVEVTPPPAAVEDTQTPRLRLVNG